MEKLLTKQMLLLNKYEQVKYQIILDNKSISKTAKYIDGQLMSDNNLKQISEQM